LAGRHKAAGGADLRQEKKKSKFPKSSKKLLRSGRGEKAGRPFATCCGAEYCDLNTHSVASHVRASCGYLSHNKHNPSHLQRVSPSCPPRRLRRDGVHPGGVAARHAEKDRAAEQTDPPQRDSETEELTVAARPQRTEAWLGVPEMRVRRLPCGWVFGGRILRRRQCRHCGRRISTIEKAMGSNPMIR